MKINKNRTQLHDEIKLTEIDLEVVMERLSLLANDKRSTAIMRWMGIGESTYTNWYRNGSVPYGVIVRTLLAKGISLDAFFAPEQRLAVPDQLILAEQARSYSGTEWQTDVIRATLEAKKLLARANVAEEELYIKFLVDLWLVNKGKMFHDRQFEDAVVNHLKALESRVESD